jgi:hypothetical protein
MLKPAPDGTGREEAPKAFFRDRNSKGFRRIRNSGIHGRLSGPRLRSIFLKRNHDESHLRSLAAVRRFAMVGCSVYWLHRDGKASKPDWHMGCLHAGREIESGVNFSVTALGKSPGIQTRFTLPAMQSEVYGTWVYDAEIKAITVFEITHTGQVRTYTANFTKPEVFVVQRIFQKKRQIS